jgi:adenosine deaminase
VVYAEIRFAPQLHTRRGLSLQAVLDAVNAGFAAGMREFPVFVATIVCCLRHEPPETSLRVAELAAANRSGVVALDLAGDEARHGGTPHAPAFDLARHAGLRRTVHAGEAAGGESVVEALEVLGAERIGHGVRVEARPGLVSSLRAAAIPLEMCPTSNVQTRAVGAFHDHPLPRLLSQGLKVTVNTDGRVTSDTSLTRELTRLGQELGLGLPDFFQLQRNAVDAAFAPDDLKAELRSRLEAARAALA